VPKPEIEFVEPASVFDWRPVAGDLTGLLREMILSEDPETGDYSRLLSFPPGTDTSPNGTLRHDTWEEVVILEGSITDLRLGEEFGAGYYACRPPGMAHGPWIAPDGAVTFEIRYRRPPP